RGHVAQIVSSFRDQRQAVRAHAGDGRHHYVNRSGDQRQPQHCGGVFGRVNMHSSYLNSNRCNTSELLTMGTSLPNCKLHFPTENPQFFGRRRLTSAAFVICRYAPERSFACTRKQRVSVGSPVSPCNLDSLARHTMKQYFYAVAFVVALAVAYAASQTTPQNNASQTPGTATP